MGYPFGEKGWKFFDLETHKFFVSRDVKFIEDVFPFKCPDATNIDANMCGDTEVDVHYDFADVVLDHDEFGNNETNDT